MTLDEAKNILTNLKYRGFVFEDLPVVKAIELGIEALEFVKDFRMGLYLEKADLLPSETEE